MPATINGTSGFGGNLTGNVTGNADTATASTTATKLSTTTGNAPTYACRAWVNFDGTRNEADTGASTNGANVKIRASGNVASVLKNSTGEYTITFTTAMPDANYAMTTSAGNTTGNSSIIQFIGTNTASAARMVVTNTANAGVDRDVSVAIFR
jgi:hypothetical protein